jgi:hypothetical protein
MREEREGSPRATRARVLISAMERLRANARYPLGVLCASFASFALNLSPPDQSTTFKTNTQENQHA